MSRTDADLLSWVVEHAGKYEQRPASRWSFVGDILGLGSTSAIDICRRFGHDPHEQMGQELCREEGCGCECHYD